MAGTRQRQVFRDDVEAAEVVTLGMRANPCTEPERRFLRHVLRHLDGRAE